VSPSPCAGPTEQAGPAASLADVLPAAAASLGLPRLARPALTFPPARAVVVLLVDGLGDALLAERGGHAPFLRRLRATQPGAVALAGFPSTTATSMGMLGTGLMPGAHGLVGLDVLDPGRDRLFSELAWDPEVDPRRWQPEPTVFEQLADERVESVRIGPGYFDGSGLTEAALRGGRFVAADTSQARATAAVEAVRAIGRGLVYVYWGEVDKSGHVFGCRSWQWGDELTAADAMAQQLAEQLPAGTLLVVTADHGMVDVPFEHRLDVADEPDLAAGVRHVGGEARALHLYCEPGAAPDVLAAWTERVGDRMQLLTREQAVRDGWFGPVHPRVLPRIGDVVVSAVGDVAVVDSRTQRPEALRLLGLHGARTDAERRVPVLLGGPAAR
jgi:hypothetical protein